MSGGGGVGSLWAVGSVIVGSAGSVVLRGGSFGFVCDDLSADWIKLRSPKGSNIKKSPKN